MFTPIETSVGAILLHQAINNLLYQNGNILGLSGFVRQLFAGPTRETLAFFAGMAASYLPLKAVAPQFMTIYPTTSVTAEAAIMTLGIGALIGLGTKMSNGCTSGHMLCGLSRLSGRSTAAVAIFFPTAILTHHLVHPTLYTDACAVDVPCYTPVYPSASTTSVLVFLAAASIVAARVVPQALKSILAPSRIDDKQQNSSRTHAREAAQLFSGLLFALGLQISGLAHPAKVLSFLSFPVLDRWDPSLALVIVFGVLPSFIEIQRKGFSTPPSFAEKFTLPTKTFKDIDVKFVFGAAAFGVGWGLSGTCPGPAVIRALAQPVWGALWFGGFWLGGRLAP